MAEWIVNQQTWFSLGCILMLLLERRWSVKMGATTLYKMWLVLPAIVIVASLPSSWVALNTPELQRYVVNFNEPLQSTPLTLSWQMAWALGAMSVIVFALYGQWSMLKNTRQGAPICVPGMTKPWRTKVNQPLTSPMIFGIIRPTLVLPEDFTTRFTKQQQAMMLEHEKVHFLRADNLANVMALVWLALCWFNPLAWLAYRAFRRSQESACDAKVLQGKTKQDQVAYCQAMLQCASIPHPQPHFYSPYGEKTTMYKRIQMIQSIQASRTLFKGFAMLLGAGLLTGVALAKTTPETMVQEAEKAHPIYRVEPSYPKQAMQEDVEGSVILRFDITAQGTTDNIEVVKGEPMGVFDQVSIDALSQWKYKPRVVGGKAQSQENLLVQLDYRLQANDTQMEPLVEGIKVVSKKQ